MPDPPDIQSCDGSIRRGRDVPASEAPDLGLDGIDLTFIRIDYQSRLQFGDTEVVIETPFQLHLDGVLHTLDPGSHKDLGPVLGLYPGTLTAAAIDDDLTLSLEFSSGAKIVVPQHAHYEAWQVVGPGSRLIVCTPMGGGGLPVWQ